MSYPQMYNADTDLRVIDGQKFVKIEVITEICKAVDAVILQAAQVTFPPDPMLFLKADGALEFSRELRFQLARL